MNSIKLATVIALVCLIGCIRADNNSTEAKPLFHISNSVLLKCANMTLLHEDPTWNTWTWTWSYNQTELKSDERFNVDNNRLIIKNALNEHRGLYKNVAKVNGTTIYECQTELKNLISNLFKN